MACTLGVIMDSQEGQHVGVSSVHAPAQSHEIVQEEDNEENEEGVEVEGEEETEDERRENIDTNDEVLVEDVINAFSAQDELEETQVMEGSETEVDDGSSPHLGSTSAGGSPDTAQDLQTLDCVTRPDEMTLSKEHRLDENTTRGPSHGDQRTLEPENTPLRERSRLVAVSIDSETGMVPKKGAHVSYSEDVLDMMATSPPMNDAGVAAEAATRSLVPAKRHAEDDTGVFRFTRSQMTRSKGPPVHDGNSEGAPIRTPAVTSKKQVTLGKSSSQLRILLTLGTAAWKRKVTALLKKLNLKVIANVPYRRTDFHCVAGGSELRTTAKLLGTLVRNKPVVTSQWIDDCGKHEMRLDPHEYIHSDLVDTMAVDRSGLFAGATFFFTEALVARYRPAGWKDVQFLMKEAGARNVHTGKTAKLSEVEEDWICLGDAECDPVATALLEAGYDVYHKDLLTQSILAGEVDLDSDEFKLSHGIKLDSP